MSEQAPAGWYPDGSGNDRFWDGASWTVHIRMPAPPVTPAAPPPAAVAVVVATSSTAESTGVFAKIGAARKKAIADKASAREEKEREHNERALAAGPMVTSGIFGTATIAIYEAGYVRVAEAGEGASTAAKIEKYTPFERLRSISFASPDAEKAGVAAPSSPLEGAVVQAMSGLMKGGKMLAKGTVIGLASEGVAQLAANAARKSNLVITTDKSIYTLANQKNNGAFNVSYKEHDAVARALVEAGESVLGTDSNAEIAVEAVAMAAAIPSTPTLSDRLRELSVLHGEGILSDDEFTAAKAKLLAGL